MRDSILVGLVGLAALAGCGTSPAPAAPTAVAPTDDAPAPSGDAELVVITAVDYEYAAARSVLTSPKDGMLAGRQTAEGTVAGHRVAVVRAGWGKVQAAGATTAAIDRYHPTTVLMAGVAGGIAPTAATSGDVVISTATFQHDLGLLTPTGVSPWKPETPLEEPLPLLLPADATVASRLFTALSSLQDPPWMLPPGCKCEQDGTPKPGQCEAPPVQVGRDAPRVCVGTLATGDSFVIDPAYGTRLATTHGAVLVDMETAAVAQECRDRGVAFGAIRVIGDVVSDSGESLYYCLKPKSGPRLAAALGLAVPALVAPTSTVTPLEPASRCMGEPSPGLPTVAAPSVEALRLR